MCKKPVLIALGAFVVGIILTFGWTNKLQQSLSENHPYETIPVIDAYYEGQKIWFIHTEVSDKKMANKLTKMVNYRTHYAPKFGDIPVENIGKLYIFTNGIDDQNTKPWGGGPFNYQIDSFDTTPDDPQYTPVRQPQLVTWKQGVIPLVLTSRAE